MRCKSFNKLTRIKMIKDSRCKGNGIRLTFLVSGPTYGCQSGERTRTIENRHYLIKSNVSLSVIYHYH